MKKLIISCLAVMLVSACNNNVPNNPAVNGNNQINKVNVNKSGLNITGNVEWNEKSFSTKATSTQISTSATISLIYPYDHPTMANTTIATGLTNESGNFSISLNGFTPATNSTYILEASKRLGDAGNSLMSMRTYMKWDGTSWKSITTPSIKINPKTTALAIISEIEQIPVNNTIGSMTITNGNTNPSNILVPFKVVYEASEGIYVANSDGTGTPILLSTNSTANKSAQLSADGSKVVYEASEGIYVANSDGSGTPVKISGSSTNNINPQISADGSKVVYVGTVATIQHIYVANSNGDTTGGYPKQISSGTTLNGALQNGAPQISADGSKITYVGFSNSNGAYNVYTANSDGTTTGGYPKRVSDELFASSRYPQISADGSKITYVGDKEIGDPPTRVVVVNFDGSNHTEIGSSSPESNNQLSSNGDKVVFTGDDEGSVIVANTYNPFNPVSISSGIGSVTYPQISSDGSKVVYEANDGIYVANSDNSGEHIRISNDYTTENKNPEFSGDGSKVTYSGDNSIYVANSDVSESPVKISGNTTNNKMPKFGGKEQSLTVSQINDVEALVRSVLAADYDPVRFIDKVGNEYVQTYSRPD